MHRLHIPSRLRLALRGSAVWLAIVVTPLTFLTLVVLPDAGFNQYAQQVVAGMSTGALYGIVALAIVLIYRSTRLLNFAQGEMAMFSAFLAWSFHQRLPFSLAFVLALASGFVMGGALERLVVRRVERRGHLNAVMVTLGLFVAINSLALWQWGAEPKRLDSPFGNGVMRVGHVAIAHHNLGVLAVSLGVVLALYLLFERTKLGLAMRATAFDQEASALMGIRVERMLTLGWALAAAMGALAGILVAPVVFVSPSMMSSVLIYAFAAAVLGGLDSPGGAVFGGLFLGVVENLSGTWDPIGSELKMVAAFVSIVLVLLVRPTGLFGRHVQPRV